MMLYLQQVDYLLVTGFSSPFTEMAGITICTQDEVFALAAEENCERKRDNLDRQIVCVYHS